MLKYKRGENSESFFDFFILFFGSAAEGDFGKGTSLIWRLDFNRKALTSDFFDFDMDGL